MRSSVGALALLVLLAGSARAEDDPGDLVRRLGSPEPGVREQARLGLESAGKNAEAAIREGLRSPSVAVTVGCADLVRRGGLLPARTELREVLARKDPARLVVHACCLALGRVGDYRDAELLGGLLPRFPAAALALAEIGDPDGLPPLRAAFSVDGPPEIAYALAALGDDAGIDALIGALDGARRLAAGLYLRRLSGRDAGPGRGAWETWWRREKLARRLGDPDWDRSEEALGGVLGTREGDDPAPEGLIEDLLAIACDEEAARDARTKAILALGLFRAPDATHPLLSVLKHDADGMVRVYAAEALGRIGDASIAPDLARYLIFDEEPFRKRSEKGRTDAYFTIDSEVSKALVAMGISGGLDYMIRQLGQQHRVRVHHESVQTLRRCTGQVLDFRPDGNTEQRRRAALEWRRWFDDHREEIELPTGSNPRDPKLVARVRALVLRLGHFHFLKMSRALETLVLLGEAAVPELREGLVRPEMHVRVHSAEVLGRIRSKSSRAALAGALGDEKPEVRTAAAAALADMGPGEEASGLVLEALGDPVLDVRIEAARAVARIEGEAGTARLRAALEDEENETFRREAWYSLAAHGDRDAVDRLSEMLDHASVPFRLVVARRISTITGRDPGGEEESIAAWREWWRVNRDRYSPLPPDGVRR